MHQINTTRRHGPHAASCWNGSAQLNLWCCTQAPARRIAATGSSQYSASRRRQAHQPLWPTPVQKIRSARSRTRAARGPRAASNRRSAAAMSSPPRPAPPAAACARCRVCRQGRGKGGVRGRRGAREAAVAAAAAPHQAAMRTACCAHRGQHEAVLNALRRALAQHGQHGVHCVAHERHRACAPLAARRRHLPELAQAHGGGVAGVRKLLRGEGPALAQVLQWRRGMGQRASASGGGAHAASLQGAAPTCHSRSPAAARLQQGLLLLGRQRTLLLVGGGGGGGVAPKAHHPRSHFIPGGQAHGDGRGCEGALGGCTPRAAP